jgi:hypothetical protein
VTQRWIEIVIGKLMTDAEVRRRFLRAPRETLAALVDQGVHLTAAEISALIATDRELWERASAQIHLVPVDANPFSE